MSHIRRCASTEAAAAAPPPICTAPTIPDIEPESGLMVPVVDRSKINILAPRKRASRREHELYHMRYRYHPPKYYRGPHHPVQMPAPSDPTSREFVPGPFNLPRLKQTYHSTINADLLTLMYQHKIPGKPDEPERIRLRPWEGESPYISNRPKRGPRGADVLKPLEKPITYRNIPKINAVHISMYQPKAKKNPDHLRVMRVLLQNMTGVRPEVTRNRISVSQWQVVKRDRTGVKVTLKKEMAYEFLDKVVNFVFPRIKEWKGLSAGATDSGGNINFGLEESDMLFFPEIEATYSLYPAKMIPGCHITIETTAKSDRHARLLFMAFGIPFEGRAR